MRNEEIQHERASAPLTVACLCAAWCRTCDGYAAVFAHAMAAHPQLRARWVDIEDEADLLGDFDVETFPTLLIADAQRVYFAGPLTPQPQTLQRVLRAALASAAAQHSDAAAPVDASAPEMLALARRLRA